ncbi:hypothetical protein Gbth_076_022 [Gluconobacter thailandicus F149-1 = NBRC 100600]|nr:hypothetical protein Gbth_076_022 [Gluconobacter thailandicus F149-1 = NBRC 100600]GBR61330.1 hypothetical protein AA100600_2686 [Gluconobacter thailandicus F149-1 = NBRC 100600]GEL88117.1 hypothetical protein GTH01_24750 [Gluconobacter thailandicus F149-1 = NBRC 100600]
MQQLTSYCGTLYTSKTLPKGMTIYPIGDAFARPMDDIAHFGWFLWREFAEINRENVLNVAC